MRGLAATLPDGATCNTAGGYTLVTPKGYMTPQCMTAAQLTAANAQYDSAAAQPAIAVNSDPLPIPTGPGVVVQGTPITSFAPATQSTAFDPIAFAQANWMWLAGGAVALILLAKG